MPTVIDLSHKGLAFHNVFSTRMLKRKIEPGEKRTGFEIKQRLLFQTAAKVMWLEMDRED